jgi:DNA-binding beta-propeller fold protein YncE
MEKGYLDRLTTVFAGRSRSFRFADGHLPLEMLERFMVFGTVVLFCAFSVGLTDPAFEYPIFLAVSADGTVFVSDQDKPAIMKITGDGKSSIVFQGSKTFRTVLHRPRGIAVDAQGNLLVCDPSTMDVYRVSPNGNATGLTGKPITELNKKPGVRGVFVQPEGVAVSSDGTIYVSDLRLHTIYALTKDSKTPKKIATVPAPHGMIVDTDGSLVVVSHGTSHLVRVDPQTGNVTNILGGRLPGKVNAFPLGVAVQSDGSYLVSDNYNRCLWRVSRDGKPEIFFESTELKKVTSVGVSKNGRVVLADPGNRCIFWLTQEKKLTRTNPNS